MLPLIGGALRTGLPSSRQRYFTRVEPFDVVWASVSPILAFLIRDGSFFRVDAFALYVPVAIVISLVVFQWFRISSALPNFFSMRDALTIAVACVITVALTTVTLFVFTRLEDAPRSIPIIHLMILIFGLIGVRAWGRLRAARHGSRNNQSRFDDLENVLVVGANRLAWFFSMMLEELSSNRRIVAIVDDRPQLINRTLNGYSIVGSPENLAKIIDEYATHGVAINKVVVATYPKDLTDSARNDVQAACKAKNISIEWLHQTFLIAEPKRPVSSEALTGAASLAAAVMARPYWKIKRLMDVVFALTMLVIFAPLAMLVAALVLIDVGVPLVFWQQRVGHLGQPLRVYKFRTMRSPFDRRGQLVPESERLSFLGRLLRQNHLDEIPQLINILTGSMSLVGPRPLLPIDQPKDIQLRLQVRPGLTGLAQINGGTSLSVDEKSVLDEWYVQNASLFLDIKILLRTVWVMIRGNPRNHAQISTALAQTQKVRSDAASDDDEQSLRLFGMSEALTRSDR